MVSAQVISKTQVVPLAEMETVTSTRAGQAVMATVGTMGVAPQFLATVVTQAVVAAAKTTRGEL